MTFLWTTRTRRVLRVVVAHLLFASSASAHHGNIIFDLDRVVTLHGSISRYVWRNPHVYVYVYVDVTDVSGQTVEWQLEGDPTPIMTRSGWTPEILSAGDPVTVRAYPDREPERPHALLVSLLKADDTILEPRSGGRASEIRATSLAGIWYGLRGYNTREFVYGRLTEKGAAAQAVYTEADNPVSECVPYPLPTIIAAPYLNEIEILDDRILVRSEFFGVERTFFTDGRPHPENGTRTNQGHSIAWWEGEVLVVDTTLYADYRAGNRSGIPSGAQKHSVERYELSADGKQLLINYVIDDPEFMVDPMMGIMVWDYAPDRELIPIGCDTQNATLYE
ncbi:MAG: DUF6152 family protein [Candidatus Rariloculaceae bacterium]